MNDPTWAYDETVATPGTGRSTGSGLRDRHARLAETFLDTVVGDRYRLKRIVGAGGFGAVFEAEDQRIRKRVAVKLLFSDMLREQETVIRFKLEAEAASQVGHNNIIDITDFDFTEDGVAYMVMEFLEGVDLAHIIRKAEKPDLARSVRLCLGACRGLAAAHRKNIIHRDLKPGNIFVCRREGAPELVKVVDFGISRAMELEEEERLTKTGQILGTPYYMAPEQADGTPDIDGRTDIYAMGIILYEACAGKLPFTARTPIGLITKHASETPRSPREVNPEIPLLLENSILKSLEKQREDRFANMEELEQALLGCLRELDPTAAAVEIAAGGQVTGEHDRLSEQALIALTTPSSILRRTAATTRAVQRKKLWIIGAAVAAVLSVALVVILRPFSSGGGDKAGSGAGAAMVPAPMTDAMEVMKPPVMEVMKPEPMVAIMKAPPRKVTVRLICTSKPRDAEVVVAKTKEILGLCNDVDLRLLKSKRKVRLILRKKGYISRKVYVLPDRDRPIGPFRLTPLSKSGGGTRDPDDVIP